MDGTDSKPLDADQTWKLSKPLDVHHTWMEGVIGDNQTGFVKDRNILEGVVVLHEVIHELKQSKRKGLILKIDFEKVYDKVRWDLLEEVMTGKGFPAQWIKWIMQTVRGADLCKY